MDCPCKNKKATAQKTTVNKPVSPASNGTRIRKRIVR